MTFFLTYLFFSLRLAWSTKEKYKRKTNLKSLMEEKSVKLMAIN